MVSNYWIDRWIYFSAYWSSILSHNVIIVYHAGSTEALGVVAPLDINPRDHIGDNL